MEPVAQGNQMWGNQHGPWLNGQPLQTERLTCSVPVPALPPMTLPARLTNWLAARQGLKIIAGLQTFAPERVRQLCNAAVAGGADLVEIGFSDFQR